MVERGAERKAETRENRTEESATSIVCLTGGQIRLNVYEFEISHAPDN